MAKDSEFRSFIYQNAKNMSDSGDDYLITLKDISKNYKYKGDNFSKSVETISSLNSKIEVSTNVESMVFFPKAETLEDNVKSNKGYNVAKNLNQPLAVLKGAYNNDYSAPGYRLDNSGELVYDRMVTEAYAWNNDVYVIGARENTGLLIAPCGATQKGDCYSGGLPGDGSGGGSGGSSSANDRVDLRQELGGEIRVPGNLNEIEHWFSGKLEFRMVVAGLEGSAATVIRDLAFGKVKRNKFNDHKWYNYDVFLFNWNVANLGDFNIEKWIEVDGGPTGEISISLPARASKPATSTTPAVDAFPGGTAKVTFKKDDDDLGTSLIQFQDDIDQVYPLGKIEIRRN